MLHVLYWRQNKSPIKFYCWRRLTFWWVKHDPFAFYDLTGCEWPEPNTCPDPDQPNRALCLQQQQLRFHMFIWAVNYANIVDCILVGHYLSKHKSKGRNPPWNAKIITLRWSFKRRTLFLYLVKKEKRWYSHVVDWRQRDTRWSLQSSALIPARSHQLSWWIKHQQ